MPAEEGLEQAMARDLDNWSCVDGLGYAGTQEQPQGRVKEYFGALAAS